MTRHRDDPFEGLPPWAIDPPMGPVLPSPPRRPHVAPGGDATGAPDRVDR